MVLGQPTGLSKKACSYVGADWLKLVCQSEDGDRSNGIPATGLVVFTLPFLGVLLLTGGTWYCGDDDVMLVVFLGNFNRFTTRCVYTRSRCY